jgi:hypothetical protein
MRAVNPFVEATGAVFDEVYGDLRDLLAALDDEAVNWTPAAPETNSIAVMTVHLVGATSRWLSRAAASPVTSDRAAEFRARASGDELTALVARAREDARQWLTACDGLDLGTLRDAGRPGWTVTAAWCIQHALAHAHEHWGQIQLTRQLHATTVGTKS